MTHITASRGLALTRNESAMTQTSITHHFGHLIPILLAAAVSLTAVYGQRPSFHDDLVAASTAYQVKLKQVAEFRDKRSSISRESDH